MRSLFLTTLALLSLACAIPDKDWMLLDEAAVLAAKSCHQLKVCALGSFVATAQLIVDCKFVNSTQLGSVESLINAAHNGSQIYSEGELEYHIDGLTQRLPVAKEGVLLQPYLDECTNGAFNQIILNHKLNSSKIIYNFLKDARSMFEDVSEEFKNANTQLYKSFHNIRDDYGRKQFCQFAQELQKYKRVVLN